MKNKFTHSYTGLALIALFLLTTTLSCKKKDTPATPVANQVLMQNIAFAPATLTVTTGSAVTWTNKDNVDHTVTSDATLFNSKSVSPNATFTFTFSTAGTYTYHCEIHGGMTGTIIVQ